MISREDYDSINAQALLQQVLAQFGKEVYLEQAKSIKAGPRFVERMNEFYDWCYEREIMPY